MGQVSTPLEPAVRLDRRRASACTTAMTTAGLIGGLGPESIVLRAMQTPVRWYSFSRR